MGHQLQDVSTPWGVSDGGREIAPGIVRYHTPSHGGYWLAEDWEDGRHTQAAADAWLAANGHLYERAGSYSGRDIGMVLWRRLSDGQMLEAYYPSPRDLPYEPLASFEDIDAAARIKYDIAGTTSDA